MEEQYEHIPIYKPIIGFTGALGSGCSLFSKEFAKNNDYDYYSLSEILHKAGAIMGDESIKNLQDIGNYLRKQEGLDCLVMFVLKEADSNWDKYNKKGLSKKGIILDGIRNCAEITALRQLPNFFLISVQADLDERFKRLSRDNRVGSYEEFIEADRRDADEKLNHGQQVKKCNYLADVVVRNDQKVSLTATTALEEYVNTKLTYIFHIEKLVQGTPDPEYKPSPEETIMTMAYVESKRSSCLKRKVGAIITTKDYNVISSGHNDVPPSSKSCLEHADYGMCARDKILEKLGNEIQYCPNCGTKIDIHTKCITCGREITSYRRSCEQCNN